MAQTQPIQPTPRMTVDEFLVWAEGRPGRYELVNGEAIAMSPQRARHAEAKASAYVVLRRAVEAANAPCRAMPDGMTVRVDRTTAYEPDALVYCGARVDPDSVEIAHPVIVVEVHSPSTKHVDTGSKLVGYFRVPSVIHYLILDPVKRLVIHHKRGEGDLIETRIASEGVLDLTPPGLSVPVADLFPEA